MTYHAIDDTQDNLPNGSHRDSVKDKARDAARKVSDNVQAGAQAASDRAQHALDTGRDHVMAAQSEFERSVQRNPGLAVLGALGAGIVLGLALRGRR